MGQIWPSQDGCCGSASNEVSLEVMHPMGAELRGGVSGADENERFYLLCMTRGECVTSGDMSGNSGLRIGGEGETDS